MYWLIEDICFFSVEECIWFHRVVAEVGYFITRGSPRLRYQLPRPRDETKILMHYSTKTNNLLFILCQFTSNLFLFCRMLILFSDSCLPLPFLAHLSTKCSGWAIVIGLCPSCVIRRPSCVVRKHFYLNIFSSETVHWILTKLHGNDP